MREGLILMARPPAAVLDAIEAQVATLGLAASEVAVLAARANLHQSLSDKHPLACRERLLQAGERIRAAGFMLVFDRVASGHEPAGAIHWTLQARGGKPGAFVDLLGQVQRELGVAGIDDRLGHTAHITLSYRAQRRLERGDHGRGAVPIAPIAWHVDSIELVAAGGDPYRYDTLMRWPLLPPRQAALF